MSTGQDVLPSISKQNLRERQQEDADLARVIFYVEWHRKPSGREQSEDTVGALRLMRRWEKLVIEDGILYCVSKDPITRKKRYQYIVPLSLRQDALHGCHDDQVTKVKTEPSL